MMLDHAHLSLTLYQRLVLLNAVEAQILNVKRRSAYRAGRLPNTEDIRATIYGTGTQLAALADIKAQLLPPPRPREVGEEPVRAPDLAPRIAEMEAML